MKLSAAITRTLRRAGLSTTDTTEMDRGREALSLIVAEVIAPVPWWWLDRTATFPTVASTRTYQPISGNVSAWFSFYDETNDNPIAIVGPDKYDLLDGDRSETGDVKAVFVEGLDDSTGYPVIGTFPTPSAVATIRVRYRLDIAEWTSTNDAKELSVLGLIRIAENVIIYGGSALLLEEEGDRDQASQEWGHHFRTLDYLKRQNLNMQGNRSYVPSGSIAGDDPLILRIGTDLASAA
jgi:hypothetical protein